ncbi:MAG: hypothetical protein D6765_14590, partial [Bacteroidetes bacterium]
SVVDLPPGATATFSANDLVPPAMAELVIENLDLVPPGTHGFTIHAASGMTDIPQSVQLELFGAPPAAPTLELPTDGATALPAQPDFSWSAPDQAAQYELEIATSPAFGGSVVETASLDGTAFSPSMELLSATVYYWRVRASNPCGIGPWSETFAFQTGDFGCDTYVSTNLPLDIPASGTGTYSTTLDIPSDESIQEITTSVFIAHSWVGDLAVSIESPAGTVVQLFDQPGVPASQFGCDGDNIDAIFDDNAPNTALDFENTCNPNPAIQGTYQPIDPLATFAGEIAQGTWTIHVTDNFNQDGGSLQEWSITLCRTGLVEPAELLANDTLPVPRGMSAVVSSTFLQTSDPNPDAVTYTLRTLPANGQLLLLGTTLAIGSTFTQQDINDGALSYQHDGSDTADDSFQFDVVDGNGGWAANRTFHLRIFDNDLALSATLDMGISCFGAADGQISIQATGGNPPLEYSLDGVNFQSSNVFSGLGPGTYTPTVRDAVGFSASASDITLSEPPLLELQTSVNDDEITALATGGTPPLEYSLDGVNFQSSNVFSGLSNGTYTVTVRDANGCTADAEAIVAVNTLIVSASIQQGISCNGAQDGSISANVGGGTAPYQFSLNGGPFQSSNVFSNLGPGTYVVTVMDADGFTADAPALTLTEPDPLSIMASASGYDITIVAGGGTPPYQYSLDGVDFQSGNTFPGNPPGDYSVFVQDANGCIAEGLVDVSVELLSLSLQVTPV